MPQTKNDTRQLKSSRELMNSWKAQSKAGKAYRLCNTILPLILLGMIFIFSLIYFLFQLFKVSSASASIDIIMTDWLMMLVNFVIFAIPCGFVLQLLTILSRISLGKYISKKSVDARKILKNEQKTKKKDELEISIALWTYEKPKSKILLFIRLGLSLIGNLVQFPFYYTAMKMLCDFMLYNTSIKAIISSSSLVALCIILFCNILFMQITENIIKNKSKDNLYA